ncbi:MAG: DUF362 domain-containing protein [Planctomycetes bacterium]|nr:DUF362 domain-containing protein [Planctomycetota bacterium]
MSARDHHQREPSHQGQRRRSFWGRWLMANSLLSGALALAWLLLRSGTKPSRLAYPCQQAAFSTAALAFGAPVVATLYAARQRLLAELRRPLGIAAVGLVLFVSAGVWGYLAQANAYRGPQLDPPRDYRARLYHVTGCPQDPVGDRFIGVERLLRLMGRDGLKFYQSATPSILAGPDGIIASDDVVVLKINYQWPERGGTNTDLLRGLIHCILDHPDGFTGEIVIGENTQSVSDESFNRAQNNAQDHGQSPQDVVDYYQGLGYQVCRKSWRSFRNTQVDEYSTGDMNDGYVVYPYDAQLHGCISYPKFSTLYGTYISLRDGIWNDGSGTYDRDRLKFINAPLLKSHHASYGATACVKHYMGVVTDGLGTNSHNAIGYGVLGALMGEIRPADLNILDCIWINAHPDDGPWTSYSAATRRDELIASLDPVAADIWAVKNILVPGFYDNGYLPPWPEPSADPDDPTSGFRVYLDNSLNWILNAGYQATNDLNQIDVLTAMLGDLNCDAVLNGFDIDAFVLAMDGPDQYYPVHPDCDHMLADVNGDGEVNGFDIDPFVALLSGA